MAKIYYESDANLDLIKGKTIGIIGFGSQGHAHALNLQDSGCNVMVGLYPGSKSWQQAQQAGIRVGTVEEVAARSGHHHDPGAGPDPAPGLRGQPSSPGCARARC